MQVNDMVVDVKSKQTGRIIESRTVADGYGNSTRFLVDFGGLQAWKDRGEIIEYITNEGTQHGGEFLTEG